MNQNDREYTIEVSMLPHPWDNEKEPYSWGITYVDEEINEILYIKHGWAKNPNEAYKRASRSYQELIKGEN